MKKLPDVILASDGIYERQALREAEILNIKSFAVFNTNGDIDLVSNLIPANTNSTKSFDYLASELKSAFSKVTTPVKAQVKKVEEKKVSGEKKAPVAKKPKAKTEEKVEETKAAE
jgi:small subunit ribosomal protein S2